MKWIVFLIGLLILAGCAQQQEGCQEDAKICPDGTAVIREEPDCEFQECPEQDKVFCKEEQRGSQFCITLHKPVCGWSDPEKIKCVKYPCAQSYTNSCVACQNPDVLYYTEGECPG